MESVHWLGWHKSGAERIQVAGLSGEQLPRSEHLCVSSATCLSASQSCEEGIPTPFSR